MRSSGYLQFKCSETLQRLNFFTGNLFGIYCSLSTAGLTYPNSSDQNGCSSEWDCLVGLLQARHQLQEKCWTQLCVGRSALGDYIAIGSLCCPWSEPHPGLQDRLPWMRNLQGHPSEKTGGWLILCCSECYWSQTGHWDPFVVGSQLKVRLVDFWGISYCYHRGYRWVSFPSRSQACSSKEQAGLSDFLWVDCSTWWCAWVIWWKACSWFMR